MITEEQQPQGFMHWLKESVTVKLIFIGILILLLMIPSALVDNLITERAVRQQQTINEVSDQYSGSQLIRGPVLVIPYKERTTERNDKGVDVPSEVVQNLYVLPNELFYKAKLNSEVRHRGIYQVSVYNGTVRVSGNFTNKSRPVIARKGFTPIQHKRFERAEDQSAG
jgi:inner membrane protein